MNVGSNHVMHWETFGIFFNLRCSSSVICMNEYLARHTGGYVYEKFTRINWCVTG